MKIVLLGYMASGKTSIGKKLAKLLKIPFFDLDAYIESKENMTISEIFQSKGEVYFRKKELIYLEEFFKNNNVFVLAVGGGTPCYGNAMEIINLNATSVYLKSSIKYIYKKLSKVKNKKKRPLIASLSNDALYEFIGKHLFERTPFYEKAKVIILTDEKPKKEIVKEISLKMQ